jgi:hypothetical protein
VPWCLCGYFQSGVISVISVISGSDGFFPSSLPFFSSPLFILLGMAAKIDFCLDF